MLLTCARWPLEPPLSGPRITCPRTAFGEEVDARSDIYSLGVVFFEILTGQRPFNEKEILKVIVQHQKALPPRPSSLNGEILLIWI